MVRQGRSLTRGTRGITLILAGWVAAGCTTLSLTPPSPSPAPAPAPGEPRAGGAPAPRAGNDASAASQSLLAQSRAQRAAGDYPQASASLERALRIDPNNAILWIELGDLHLQAGNTAQAEMMARKALTLTGADRAAASQAERLLRAAAR
jgi:tetratricopeptide (TPR) repeat protein